jgi:hypothetical protein
MATDPELKLQLDFELSEEELRRLQELDEVQRQLEELDFLERAQSALSNTRSYYNDRMRINNADSLLLHEADGMELDLTIPSPGFRIEIAAGSKTRSIGHFCPARGEPIIYYDFTNPDDSTILQKLAKRKYEEAFEVFSRGAPGREWFAYDHPSVRAMHQKHMDALFKRGLLNAFAAHYNYEVPGLSKGKRFDFNSESSAAVCMVTKLNSFGGVSEQTLALRLIGTDEYDNEGVKTGNINGIRFIDFAKLTSEGELGAYYAPIRQGDYDLVEPDLLDELIDLSFDVRKLEGIPGFSSEHLGIKLQASQFQQK